MHTLDVAEGSHGLFDESKLLLGVCGMLAYCDTSDFRIRAIVLCLLLTDTAMLLDKIAETSKSESGTSER